MTDFKKQGKKNRASGKRFELKVRADLEKSGWIVFRNSNDVEKHIATAKEIEESLRLTGSGFCTRQYDFKQAKQRWFFNPVLKRRIPAMVTGGFPDFVCIKFIGDKLSEWMLKTYGNPHFWPNYISDKLFEVQFVDAKIGKYLKKKEKEKCEWIEKELKIEVNIAYQEGEGRKKEIKYKRWNE